MKSVDTASGTSQPTPTISLMRKKTDNSAIRTQSLLRLLVAFSHKRRIDPTGTEASKQAQQEKYERGKHKAENIGYSEAVSEHGFGGETADTAGMLSNKAMAGLRSLKEQKRRLHARGARVREGTGVGA
jgi:hypothetical protein